MISFDLTNWMMVFVRVSALLAIFPLFSTQNVPVQARLALGALISFLLAPGLPTMAHAPTSLITLALLMAVEIGVGLLLGFVSRLLFYILEFAGNVISSEMGLNWGATLNPLSNTRSEVPGLMLFYLGAMAFLTLDMHQWILRALQRSASRETWDLLERWADERGATIEQAAARHQRRLRSLTPAEAEKLEALCCYEAQELYGRARVGRTAQRVVQRLSAMARNE